ncbi:MAG: DUF3500 domain-containing protein [Verrucomicrobiales bacterium]|nr:DUF3500 domain-containing protein [Verrucomicrobiales bacterium]
MKYPLNQSTETRRSFLGKSILGAGGAAIIPESIHGEEVAKKASAEPKAESLIRELLSSLSEEQREKFVIPFDNPLRHKIENNWHILRERVGTHFDSAQQLLVRDIFRELHSEQLRDEVWRQFLEDNRSKNAKTPDEIFGTASVAIFEEPETDKFEFVLTGRHTTRRCDGNATEGVAFGGPIFYGHASKGFYEKPDHPGNAYWFQAKRANELFEMLDGKQREKALKNDSRGEQGTKTIELTGKKEGLDGIPAWEMTADQRKLMLDVVTDLLAPFREEDRIEAASMINNQISDTHIAFYKNEDVGDDKVWDTWQIEGPQLVWYFRGDPHVHTWVHVKEPVAEKKA